MRALVVYEPTNGNAELVGDQIARGLAHRFDVAVVSVDRATVAQLAAADLLVVGGDASAGLRDWLHGMDRDNRCAAASYDICPRTPTLLRGQPTRPTRRGLRRRGFHLVGKAESFMVGRDDRLVEGEAERARAWGELLAKLVFQSEGAAFR